MSRHGAVRAAGGPLSKNQAVKSLSILEQRREFMVFELISRSKKKTKYELGTWAERATT